VKVLHVIPAVAARYGGPSTAVLAMCRALVSAGIDVELATTDADGARRLPVPTGTRAAVNYGGVPTTFFRARGAESIKFAPRFRAWLRREVSRFDVVHIHALMSYTSVVAARTSAAAGVPFILRPLGTLDAWSLSQKPLKKRLFLALGGAAIIKRARAIHCTSPGEVEAVERRFGATQTVLLPLGIEETLLADRADERDSGSPYVLHLSRLHPVKRIDRLIDAFAEAVAGDTAHGWRLKIAGDGDAGHVEQLKRHAGRSRAAGRIDFLGWVDGDRRREVTRRAALMALVSSHENFGLSAIEALAAGVPVVVSDGVQIAPWVQDAGAGWVSGPGLDDLAAILRGAMTEENERRMRGEAGRRLAARFTWPSIAADLVRLYEGVLAPAGRRLASEAIPDGHATVESWRSGR
jgi:glycosyltransferase involved in cell wall biosynthesis